MPEDWFLRALRPASALALSFILLGCVAAPPAGEPSAAAPTTSEGAALGQAPDPFASEGAGGAAFGEAEDPFAAQTAPVGTGSSALGQAPDPFAAPAESGGGVSPDFEPDAVKERLPPPGFEVHGRASLALVLPETFEPIERLRGLSPALSSVDLYLQWFPLHWFGAVGEVEGEVDLGEEEREIEPELELLALELRPLSDERIRLRVGFAPVPFGAERRSYAPPRNLFVNRPAPFRRLYPGTYADAGAFLWIKQPFWEAWGVGLELEAAMTRGLTGEGRDGRPEPFDHDVNGEPQFSGRLALTLLDVDPERRGPETLSFPLRLTLGGSFLWENYDSEAQRELRFLGFDAELILYGFEARVEYVERKLERSGRTARGRGLYAIAAYRWQPGWSLLEEAYLAFRYGVLDPDDDLGESFDLERYHLGLGWSPFHGVLAKLGGELSVSEAGVREHVLYTELGFSF